jgi:hypothetical protein
MGEKYGVCAWHGTKTAKPPQDMYGMRFDYIKKKKNTAHMGLE